MTTKVQTNTATREDISWKKSHQILCSESFACREGYGQLITSYYTAYNGINYTVLYHIISHYITLYSYHQPIHIIPRIISNYIASLHTISHHMLTPIIVLYLS